MSGTTVTISGYSLGVLQMQRPVLNKPEFMVLKETSNPLHTKPGSLYNCRQGQ